jgi:homospermidine synthase
VPVARLDVTAIHVTEEDTTATAACDPGVFAMSWSPRHALDELLEPHAMYVAHGRIARLPHRPHEARYTARCGDREIAGMIVPHEELVSIGARFPSVEAAFFYAIPDAAATALRRHPERTAADWPIRRLYAPHTDRLVGHDRVGVLIGSRRFGELWIGFEHAADLPATGNGTLLQAAAGVLAGWSQLGTRRGVHVVDELDRAAYLAVVEAVLGRCRITHAPDAMPRSVIGRRVTAA